MCVQEVNQHLSENEDESVGHYRIESVLNEGLKPAPEEPLQIRNHEKRDEDRPYEDANGLRYQAERNYAEEHEFRGRKRQ